MIDTPWNISYDPANKKTDKKTKSKCLIQL